MNCNDAKDLISLYIGRDLDEADAAIVAEHLRNCAECSELESEYSETIRTIRQFSPPEFGDAVYAGIRRRVMDDISRKTARPRLADRLAALSGSYARLASAAPAVLAIGIAAFYYVATVEKKPSQLAAGDGPVLSSPPSPSAVDTQDPGVNPDVARPAFPPRGTAVKRSADRRHRNTAGPARQTVAQVRKSKRPRAAETLVAHHRPNADSGSVPDQALRVEMQTSDPNIRIIWFANITPKSNSRN